MRLIVCGGRDFDWWEFVYEILAQIHKETPITLLIEGGARGVDSIASQWANANKIDNLTIPADWDKHGRSAGPIRNAEMLKERPDMVIAFPGGPGTANMIKQSAKANIPVRVITYEREYLL